MKPPMLSLDIQTSVPFYCDLRLTSRVAHGFFTRHGGVSVGDYSSLNISYNVGDDPLAVALNRRTIVQAVSPCPYPVIVPGLVHGDTVTRVDRNTIGDVPNTRYVTVDRTDALITNDPCVTLMSSSADCASVLFVDQKRPAIGLAHAGWRGSVAGILTATVTAMVAAFQSSPADLNVMVGPSLGPCCTEFTDPKGELPEWCHPYINGTMVDFWTINYDQLVRAGVMDASIGMAHMCTLCRRDTFFSHRGDRGKTGRCATVASIIAR